MKNSKTRTIETRQVSSVVVPELTKAKRQDPWVALHACPGSTLITEFVPLVRPALSVPMRLEQSVVRGRKPPACTHDVAPEWFV